jgi:hypothetical protein
MVHKFITLEAVVVETKPVVAELVAKAVECQALLDSVEEFLLHQPIQVGAALDQQTLLVEVMAVVE